MTADDPAGRALPALYRCSVAPRELPSPAGLLLLAGLLPSLASGHPGDAGIDRLELFRLRVRALDTRMWLVRAGYARLAQRVDLHLALGGDIAD